jgi:hypothetical protein
VTPISSIEQGTLLGDLNRQVRGPKPDACRYRDSENRIGNIV